MEFFAGGGGVVGLALVGEKTQAMVRRRSHAKACLLKAIMATVKR